MSKFSYITTWFDEVEPQPEWELMLQEDVVNRLLTQITITVTATGQHDAIEATAELTVDQATELAEQLRAITDRQRRSYPAHRPLRP